ncbi:MAG: hypothetical protein KY445_15325, partial [Armatimonadetes bacterium]|nr:hypothetical protein [Armatimonadota bacterium]
MSKSILLGLFAVVAAGAVSKPPVPVVAGAKALTTVEKSAATGMAANNKLPVGNPQPPGRFPSGNPQPPG